MARSSTRAALIPALTFTAAVVIAAAVAIAVAVAPPGLALGKLRVRHRPEERHLRGADQIDALRKKLATLRCRSLWTLRHPERHERHRAAKRVRRRATRTRCTHTLAVVAAEPTARIASTVGVAMPPLYLRGARGSATERLEVEHADEIGLWLLEDPVRASGPSAVRVQEGEHRVRVVEHGIRIKAGSRPVRQIFCLDHAVAVDCAADVPAHRHRGHVAHHVVEPKVENRQRYAVTWSGARGRQTAAGWCRSAFPSCAAASAQPAERAAARCPVQRGPAPESRAQCRERSQSCCDAPRAAQRRRDSCLTLHHRRWCRRRPPRPFVEPRLRTSLFLRAGLSPQTVEWPRWRHLRRLPWTPTGRAPSRSTVSQGLAHRFRQRRQGGRLHTRRRLQLHSRHFDQTRRALRWRDLHVHQSEGLRLEARTRQRSRRSNASPGHCSSCRPPSQWACLFRLRQSRDGQAVLRPQPTQSRVRSDLFHHKT
eukprot:2085010-Pleurochrysis_carterae.AAC.3